MMDLHNKESTLTVERDHDGALILSINAKRAVTLASGERAYYGASITLSRRQEQIFLEFLSIMRSAPKKTPRRPRIPVYHSAQ